MILLPDLIGLIVFSVKRKVIKKTISSSKLNHKSLIRFLGDYNASLNVILLVQFVRIQCMQNYAGIRLFLCACQTTAIEHTILIQHFNCSSFLFPMPYKYRCVAHGFITFYFLIFYRWSNLNKANNQTSSRRTWKRPRNVKYRFCYRHRNVIGLNQIIRSHDFR
jgi:hypothetical protein